LINYSLDVVPDDMPIEGNALASGDDELDATVEREIAERLARGDVWAWCIVAVTAEYKGFTGVVHLGGCSYRDEEDFKQEGGYYEDLKREARDSLLADLRAAVQRGDVASQLLQELDE
jgi:hypothetical protein